MRSSAVMLLAAVLLGGCAARAPHVVPEENDPWEPFNRKMFWFNDKLDVHVLEPAAKGWNFIFPRPVQRSVNNFFTNIRFPVVAMNDLLQGKVRASAVDVGRFGINSTVGVLGFFDPAAHWGLEGHDEDFGQTLGVWGLGPGPYLVLPVIGPSDVRDGIGLGVDTVFSVTPFFIEWFWTTGARVIDVINFRAMILEEVRTAREAAIDYYAFVRSAYFQRREALIEDRTTGPGERGLPEDIYDISPRD